MGLTRQTFKHTAIYSFATVLGRMISFIMLPFYAYIFHTEGYGVIGMVDASLGLLSILFAAGFHVAILKIYHEETGTSKRLVISTAIRLVWYLSAASIIIPAIFCSQLSAFFLGSREYSLIVLLALITFVIDVAGQSASTFLIIEQKSMLYSLVGVIRLLLGVSLNILARYYPEDWSDWRFRLISCDCCHFCSHLPLCSHKGPWIRIQLIPGQEVNQIPGASYAGRISRLCLSSGREISC